MWRILVLLLAAWAASAQGFTVIAGESGTKLDQPYGLGIGPDGALYFCEIGNHRISRLDLKTHAVTVVVGTGEKGYAGDGGPALSALVDEPYELAFDRMGNLFFCDQPRHVIRRVDRTTQVITTVAGSGKAGFAGDGGPALQAEFRQPHSIAFAPVGGLLICDIGNSRVRRLDLGKGTIDTWAGPMKGPRAIAISPSGALYLALREGNAVQRRDAAGEFRPFAGSGEQGYSGDGGPAMSAKLAGPKGIALAPDGSLYIADTENHAIRRVDPKGIITTVAGDGQRGGGRRLARPHGVFADAGGKVYVADSENNRILVLE
jgi:DNA-binding beta-propeller fold protein YncE